MNVTRIADSLRPRVRGRVKPAESLADYTTYRLGGPAGLYFEPADVDDLQQLAEVLAAERNDVPILPLGRGSNVVVSDHGFPGIVVRLGMPFAWIEPIGDLDDATEMVAGAATSLPLLANWSARRGLTGLEFAVAIPGSVGGGVRMNAGAHGREIVDSLASVRLFDLTRETVREVTASQLDMSYRRSALLPTEIVLEARFRLVREVADVVRQRMESYRRHRSQTQPGAVQNAGSVFKNPPGDHAGRLVEAAGLKGFGVGGAAVSELHANFFVAGDGATSQDVFDLVNEVRKRVAERSGVELEPEIRFIGDFELPAEANGGRR